MKRGARITNGPGVTLERPTGSSRARALLNARTDTDHREWFRLVENKAEQSAEVFIYDEIGYWGTSAAEFVQMLNALDVKAISVRINSPGGEVFDGVAIYNALKTHKATVTVSVDGLAASAASFIATAGDKVIMQRGAQMMIHDAAGMAFGNAETMRTLADLLDRLSDTIAGLYADRAGGSLTSWRDAMRVETWYNADEAVAAGLADEAAAVPAPENSAVPRHTWDLRNVLGYHYANRTEAPTPAEIDRTKPTGELPPVAEVENIEVEMISLDDMRAALRPIEVAIDSAELFAAVQFGITTVPEPSPPAPKPTPVPAPESAPALDIRDFREAVREGNL